MRGHGTGQTISIKGTQRAQVSTGYSGFGDRRDEVSCSECHCGPVPTQRVERDGGVSREECARLAVWRDTQKGR